MTEKLTACKDCKFKTTKAITPVTFQHKCKDNNNGHCLGYEEKV